MISKLNKTNRKEVWKRTPAQSFKMKLEIPSTPEVKVAEKTNTHSRKRLLV